jgi:hypothetical protein
MGVDLMGHSGASFNWQGWRSLLRVARVFGWQPAGTTRSDENEGDWDGSYFTNDLQGVTDEDAKAMARALFRALNAVWTDQPLSTDQAKALDEADIRVVMELANYAFSGGFIIA